MIGYHHARYTVNLLFLFKLGALIKKYHLFMFRLSSLILFDQTTTWEDAHIASAHGAHQLESRPSRVNDYPCWCRSRAMASTTYPRRTFQEPLSLPCLKDSYSFRVELYQSVDHGARGGLMLSSIACLPSCHQPRHHGNTCLGSISNPLLKLVSRRNHCQWHP
jgi:hypothetical protein